MAKVVVDGPSKLIRMADMIPEQYGVIRRCAVGGYVNQVVLRCHGSMVLSLEAAAAYWSWTEEQYAPDIMVEILPPGSVITITV